MEEKQPTNDKKRQNTGDLSNLEIKDGGKGPATKKKKKTGKFDRENATLVREEEKSRSIDPNTGKLKIVMARTWQDSTTGETRVITVVKKKNTPSLDKDTINTTVIKNNPPSVATTTRRRERADEECFATTTTTTTTTRKADEEDFAFYEEDLESLLPPTTSTVSTNEQSCGEKNNSEWLENSAHDFGRGSALLPKDSLTTPTTDDHHPASLAYDPSDAPYNPTSPRSPYSDGEYVPQSPSFGADILHDDDHQKESMISSSDAIKSSTKRFYGGPCAETVCDILNLCERIEDTHSKESKTIRMVGLNNIWIDVAINYNKLCAYLVQMIPFVEGHLKGIIVSPPWNTFTTDVNNHQIGRVGFDNFVRDSLNMELKSVIMILEIENNNNEYDHVTPLVDNVCRALQQQPALFSKHFTTNKSIVNPNAQMPTASTHYEIMPDDFILKTMTNENFWKFYDEKKREWFYRHVVMFTLSAENRQRLPESFSHFSRYMLQNTIYIDSHAKTLHEILTRSVLIIPRHHRPSFQHRYNNNHRHHASPSSKNNSDASANHAMSSSLVGSIDKTSEIIIEVDPHVANNGGNHSFHRSNNNRGSAHHFKTPRGGRREGGGGFNNAGSSSQDNQQATRHYFNSKSSRGGGGKSNFRGGGHYRGGNNNY